MHCLPSLADADFMTIAHPALVKEAPRVVQAVYAVESGNRNR